MQLLHDRQKAASVLHYPGVSDDDPNCLCKSEIVVILALSTATKISSSNFKIGMCMAWQGRQKRASRLGI